MLKMCKTSKLQALLDSPTIGGPSNGEEAHRMVKLQGCLSDGRQAGFVGTQVPSSSYEYQHINQTDADSRVNNARGSQDCGLTWQRMLGPSIELPVLSALPETGEGQGRLSEVWAFPVHAVPWRWPWQPLNTNMLLFLQCSIWTFTTSGIESINRLSLTQVSFAVKSQKYCFSHGFAFWNCRKEILNLVAK